ncbi:MAG: TldD/PmbA family protein [Proteobacteria bacterium]|nr:TldD/PmbA family protein [Pseudomonadota bacterium]
MITHEHISRLIESLSKARPNVRFDISGDSLESQTVKVKENENFEQTASQRTSALLRVWTPAGRIGVVQVTSLDHKQLLSALDVAAEAASLGPAEDLPSIPLPADAGTLPELNSTSAGQPVSIEELGTNLLAAVRQLRQSHPDISGVPYNALSQRRAQRFYANTEGLIREQNGAVVSTYLYARGQSEGHKPRAAGHWGEERSMQSLDLSAVAKTASELLVSHLKPIKISSGQYPVIFSGRAFLDLLGAFSNLFSAQNILDRQSLHTKDSLGQQIAASLLNVADDPLHPANVSPDLFDGEGTAVRKLSLIENGVLTGLWHHSVSAKTFGVPKTGHANVGAKMTVRPWFWNVSAGQGLGDAARDCVWIDDLEALHAGVNSLQGSFSLPFLGYRIVNGRKESLEGVTVAGDILSVLKNITALDSSCERASGGVCPAVAVSALSITCEA